MLGDQNSHRASLQALGQTVVELAALALACLCGSLQSLERWAVACFFPRSLLHRHHRYFD